MNKNEEGFSWIGHHYEEDTSQIKELRNRRQLLFYRKCAINRFTIKPNDVVLVKNLDHIQPENVDTCYVAKIRYLYESISFSDNKSTSFALVQWYSRPNELPKLESDMKPILESLDGSNEVVVDDRHVNEITIDQIFDTAEIFGTKQEFLKCGPARNRFFCSYRLEPSGHAKLFKLVSLRETSGERLGLILKRVWAEDESISSGQLKSPHGRWIVKMNRITEDTAYLALNSIENLNNTPKRSTVGNDHTPAKRSTRKSHTPHGRFMNNLENVEADDEDALKSTPKKKTRRNPALIESSAPCTPTTRSVPARRKSILKTPTSKICTPKRNIQFSGVVEEHEYVKKSARDKISIVDDDNEKSDLAIVRQRLHVSAVPKSLPCREKEYTEIYSFLEGNLLDECGGCIYISGVPGTGKTATVTEVIRSLKAEVAKHTIPKFEFVEINGMRITEPRKAYVEIHRQLTGKAVSWEQAYNFLDKRFSTQAKRRISTILMVDELDILCNKRQDVVYNLLNWPTLNSARLIVVTIANTMDLPERLLMGKVTSRLGLTRLTFQPYSHKQLQEIVTSRLSGLDSFNSDGIQLVARKVAALSGDARRALDICRRASEIAEMEKNGEHASVLMSHVQQALSEMISCTKVRAVRACSKMEKFFLQAVCMEVERTGIEEVSFYGVFNQLKAVVTLNGFPVPTTETILSISSRLDACRLIISEDSRKDIYQKILLNISADDFYYATKLKQQDEI